MVAHIVYNPVTEIHYGCTKGTMFKLQIRGKHKMNNVRIRRKEREVLTQLKKRVGERTF